MKISLSDQQRAVKEFWKSEAQNLEAATRAVIRTTARALKREAAKQLRRFKKGPTANGTFQKAVKLYDLEARGRLGPATFVRLGVPFMDAFQEGKTVQAKGKYLILLTSQGAALGYQRISKGNRWAKVWEGIKRQARLIRVNGGILVLLKKDGRDVPIYKLQSEVKVPKKISFLETAEQLSEGMAEEINRLLEGG